MQLTFLGPVRAQDLMRHLDLTSPDMTSAEMTRADVETALSSRQTDFSGKKLSGLDLSGLDLSAIEFRAARLNKTHRKLGDLVSGRRGCVGAECGGPHREGEEP